MVERDVVNVSVAAVAGRSRARRVERALLQVLGFCLLTALCAQVRIPVPGSPVPLTLQSTAVLLAGYFLPLPLAVAAMVLYVGAGWAGAPVFAPGSLGLAGVTGGYIVGFVLGAAVVSGVSGGRRAGAMRLLVAGAAGTAMIFLCGVLWQTLLLGGAWAEVVGRGVLPFMPKAVVQLCVAVAAVRAIRGTAPRRASDGRTF